MKVLLVNGSPHQMGCTHTALSEVAAALREEGIDTDFYWIGNKLIGGCIGCFQCTKKLKCVFDDKVNEFTALAAGYDGFVFGSPVYYSGMNGSLMSFMDRVFFSASAQVPHPFRFKPAASIVSARRAGTTTALDQLNKYFFHQQMPIATSRYWNMVHGNTPEERLFVTTKVAAEHKDYKSAAEGIDESLRKMGLDYIDMMIIHSPQPWKEVNQSDNRYIEGNREAWRACRMRIRPASSVRSAYRIS